MCTCNQGWYLSDCSMPAQDYEAMMSKKQQMVEGLKSAFDQLEPNQDKTEALTALENIIQNPEFVNNEIAHSIEELLESSLTITSEDASATNLTQ